MQHRLGEWRPVGVWAADLLTTAALTGAVRTATGVEACDLDDLGPDSVLVVAADRDGRAHELVETLPPRTSVVWVTPDVDAVRAPERAHVTVLTRAQFGADVLLLRLRQLTHPVQSPAAEVAVTATVTSQPTLTQRQIEVLRLLAQGHDTARIAAALFYSERTVKNVIHHVVQALQVRNRSQAVAVAVRTGLV